MAIPSRGVASSELAGLASGEVIPSDPVVLSSEFANTRDEIIGSPSRREFLGDDQLPIALSSPDYALDASVAQEIACGVGVVLLCAWEVLDEDIVVARLQSHGIRRFND